MKHAIAVLLSAILAMPAGNLLAQQASGTTQKPIQVAQAEAGAAGAGAAAPAAGAAAATGAAIGGVAVTTAVVAAVAVAAAIAVATANEQAPIATTGTR